jgi:hypothetical protein
MWNQKKTKGPRLLFNFPYLNAPATTISEKIADILSMMTTDHVDVYSEL